MLALHLCAALLLDRWWGEAPRCHPLVAFGRVASWVERGLHPLDNHHYASRSLQIRGAIAVIGLVIVPSLLASWFLAQLPAYVASALSLLVLYVAIGYRSLHEHARAIAAPLAAGDITQAKIQVARIVSRDTHSMEEQGVARAAVESVLENGNDAVVAPLLWYCIGGAPMVIAHRLSNTLDAMWGYRNERYRDFGRCAARLDDVLNWPTARVCALAYALVGNTAQAWRCWRTQAQAYASPNAGPVMAAGAGALGVRLGGAVQYHGAARERGVLGCGRTARAEDIAAALRLLGRAVLLVIVAVAVIEWLLV